MNRPDALTPEERELARLLGRAAPAAPPAAVDEAVLAAARAAIRPGAAADVPPAGAAPVHGTHRRRSRLPAVFGLAASLVFAVGIAWQLKPEAPPPAAPVSAAAEAAAEVPAPAAAEAAVSAAATTETVAPARAEPATPAAAAKPQGARAAPAPKPAPPPLPPAPSGALRAEAPVAPAPMAAPMAAPSPPEARIQADQAPELDSVVVTGSRINESRERTQAKGAPGVMRRAAPAPAATSAYGALSANAIAVAVDADAALPRRQWIKRIRERRDDGDVDTARASLERYLQHYPEARIPQDLRELLDPH
ncbi:hypothetical protein ACGFZ3_04125 [Stenotrophomonas sp. NPDC047960]|uniref:hypothetical protein n=1 Tax=Stenotrophomonas sp. NPDC047960 TaxID=3364531 RepID=UPI00371E7898